MKIHLCKIEYFSDIRMKTRNIKYLLMRRIVFIGTSKHLRAKVMLKVVDSLQH
jgi:hypothetical protein